MISTVTGWFMAWKITWQWSVSTCPRRRYLYSSRSHHNKFRQLAADIRERQAGKNMQFFKRSQNLPLQKQNKGGKLNVLVSNFLRDILSFKSLLWDTTSGEFLWLILPSHLNSLQSFVGSSDILWVSCGFAVTFLRSSSLGALRKPSAGSKLRCFKCKVNSPALGTESFPGLCVHWDPCRSAQWFLLSLQ